MFKHKAALFYVSFKYKKHKKEIRLLWNVNGWFASSATLIDNIFTNNHDNLNYSLSGILVADVSDHFPIFHINQFFTVEETE